MDRLVVAFACPFFPEVLLKGMLKEHVHAVERAAKRAVKQVADPQPPVKRAAKNGAKKVAPKPPGKAVAKKTAKAPAKKAPGTATRKPAATKAVKKAAKSK